MLCPPAVDRPSACCGLDRGRLQCRGKAADVDALEAITQLVIAPQMSLCHQESAASDAIVQHRRPSLKKPAIAVFALRLLWIPSS